MLFRTSRIHAAAATALSKVSGKGRAITATLYIGALIVGSLIGFAGNTDINAVMDFIATVFTRLFSFIAVPIIAVSLISTLANLSKNSKGGSIFAHTIFYTLLTTILAALLGAVLFAVIKPANVPAALSSSAADVVTKYESLSYLEHIQNIIPNNLLRLLVLELPQ